MTAPGKMTTWTRTPMTCSSCGSVAPDSRAAFYIWFDDHYSTLHIWRYRLKRRFRKDAK